MNTFIAMIKKDFQLLMTDKVTLFFTFIFPLLFAGLFGNMMGSSAGSKKISIAVVQQDNSTAATQFAEVLANAKELKVKLLSLEAASDAVRKGDLVAYLVLPEGFGQKYQQVFSGKTPEVIIGVDPKRTAEAGLLEGVLMKYGAERFKTTFGSVDVMRSNIKESTTSIQADPNIPDEWRQLLTEYLPKIDALLERNPPGSNAASEFGGFVPLKIVQESVQRQSKGPSNSQAVFFPQAMLWAILGCIMGFGTSLVQENSKGTMMRMQVAPISPLSILFGKSLTCAVTIMMVIGFLVVIGMNVFGMPMQSFALLALALFAIAICFSGLMMMLAAIAKTEQALNGMGWAVLMIFAMVGGAMLPLFLMPEWLQQASHVSPVKWGILALEGAIWRDFSLREMLLPCTVLLGIGLVSYAVGLNRFKRFSEAV